jgi:hypothetical protein
MWTGLMFAQKSQNPTSLIEFGNANVTGNSMVQVPMTPVTFLDQAPNQVNGLFADSDCELCPTLQQTIADNFTANVTNGTTCITELVIWGGYYPEDIPNATDDFTFIFHENNAGQPGAVITSFSGVQAASRVQTGVVIFGTHEYMFTFDFSATPITLPQGSATYWLELYNNSVESGNFYWETGNLDGTHGVLGSAWYTTTPGTAWNLDGATDLSVIINGDDACVPCPVGAPTNPNPATGSVDVDIDANLSWTNGAGTTEVEVFFNGVSVYSGAPITTFDPGTMEYSTTYTWKVYCGDGTCSTSGPTWSFTTEQNPNLQTVLVYPQSSDYWTGTCDASNKTQVSLVNAINLELGWMAFDISSIPVGTDVVSVTFHGYLYANNWPYWSITPMGNVNPITGTATDIYNQVSTNYDQGLAYSFNQETGTLANDWQARELTDNNAVANFEAALAQGWFAIGIVDWDFSTSYYVEYQGWAEANVPYLEVVIIVPVELTSFTAIANDGTVELNWATATETNNQGFSIERSSGSEFTEVGFVPGHGTSTETHSYSFTDRNVQPGTYTYRLKQIDFDGSYEYFTTEVEVAAPKVYSLEQNYPNPFNPSTKINFSLAVDSKVTLKVFDILGQEVTILLTSDLVAGSHEVNFNASGINSGVYFYSIEATGIDGTNFVDVKKMILTK